MGEQAHTPGPWDLEAGFLITRAFVGGVGIPLLHFEGRASEAGEAFGWITGKPDEHRANERLIASAPELFDFATEVARVEGGTPLGRAARAVIAKATGERT